MIRQVSTKRFDSGVTRAANAALSSGAGNTSARDSEAHDGTNDTHILESHRGGEHVRGSELKEESRNVTGLDN